MTVSSFVKIDASKGVSKLEKNADKLERVATNSPSTRNAAQAAEARTSAKNASLRNEAAGTATTESTESALGKKVENVSLSVGNVEPFKVDSPKIDNTFVIKPLILPKQ